MPVPVAVFTNEPASAAVNRCVQVNVTVPVGLTPWPPAGEIVPASQRGSCRVTVSITLPVFCTLIWYEIVWPTVAETVDAV